jgi:hypothetical protein
MAEVLVYISGPAGILLLMGSAVTEVPAGLSDAYSLYPLKQILTYMVSFLVNLTCFFAIKTTSSLIFKVSAFSVFLRTI